MIDWLYGCIVFPSRKWSRAIKAEKKKNTHTFNVKRYYTTLFDSCCKLQLQASNNNNNKLSRNIKSKQYQTLFDSSKLSNIKRSKRLTKKKVFFSPYRSEVDVPLVDVVVVGHGDDWWWWWCCWYTFLKKTAGDDAGGCRDPGPSEVCPSLKKKKKNSNNTHTHIFFSPLPSSSSSSSSGSALKIDGGVSQRVG